MSVTSLAMSPGHEASPVTALEDLPDNVIPTISHGRIPSLDGLRAAAILLVILSHVSRTGNSPVPAAALWYTTQGAVGVDLFFAISGFLITTLLLRERDVTGTVSLGGFYIRRALRILPAFFAFLAGMAIFNQLGWIHLVSHDWIAALTYTVNFFDDVSRPLGHIWSLSVEEHFYLIWPPLFLILGVRRAGRLALICFLAEPLVRWLTFHYASGLFVIDFATFTRLDAIAAGCLLAIGARAPAWRPILDRLDASPARWFFTSLGILILSVCVLSQSGKYALFARPWINALAICVMIHTATGSPTTSFGRFLNWAPLAWIGRLSYSLYLWQQVFLDPSNSERWMCRFPQNLGLCLAAAIASHYLIELPFLRMKKRRGEVRRRMMSSPSVETMLAPDPQLNCAASGPYGIHANSSVRRTLVSAACLSLQPLLLNVLSVPVLAYIIHQLGPEGYGQWMVATALLTVCAILTSLGLRGAFVRSVAADPASAATALAEQLGLRLSLTTIAAVLAVLVCLLLGYSSAVVWCTVVGAVGLAMTTFTTTLGDLLQSMHRIKTLAAVSLIAGLALTGASMVAAWFGTGPVAMAVSYLTGPVISAALLYGLVRKHVCTVTVRWNIRRFGILLARSRFLAAQQLLSVASTQAESLLLPRLIGASQFGFFSAGTIIANRLTAIPDGLCTAAFPGMVKASARGIARDALLMLFKYGLAAAGVGILIACAAMFAADPIGRFLFPGQSALFTNIVCITIWSLPLTSVDMVMGYALNAAGKDGAQARAVVPAAIVSVLGAVALVSGFGLIGACWSMLLRPAVRVAFLAPVVFKVFRPHARPVSLDRARISPSHSTTLLHNTG